MNATSGDAQPKRVYASEAVVTTILTEKDLDDVRCDIGCYGHASRWGCRNHDCRVPTEPHFMVRILSFPRTRRSACSATLTWIPMWTTTARPPAGPNPRIPDPKSPNPRITASLTRLGSPLQPDHSDWVVHEQDLLDYFQPEWTESAPVLEFDANQYMELMNLEGDDQKILYEGQTAREGGLGTPGRLLTAGCMLGGPGGKPATCARAVCARARMRPTTRGRLGVSSKCAKTASWSSSTLVAPSSCNGYVRRDTRPGRALPALTGSAIVSTALQATSIRPVLRRPDPERIRVIDEENVVQLGRFHLGASRNQRQTRPQHA